MSQRAYGEAKIPRYHKAMQMAMRRRNRPSRALVGGAVLLGVVAACLPWQTVVDTVTGGAEGSAPFTSRWTTYLWDGSTTQPGTEWLTVWARLGLICMVVASLYTLGHLQRIDRATASVNRVLAVLTTTVAVGALVATGLWYADLLISPFYNDPSAILVMARIEMAPSVGGFFAMLACLCLLIAGPVLWNSGGELGEPVGTQPVPATAPSQS